MIVNLLARLKRKIAYLFFRFGIYFRFSPKVLSFFFVMGCRIKGPIDDRSVANILVLEKVGFVDDVMELARLSPHVRFIFAPRLWLTELFETAGVSVCGLTDASYHVTLSRAEKNRVRHSLAPFFDAIRRATNFDLVLSANFPYVSQQELFWWCRQRSIPIWVIYREGLVPDAMRSDYFKDLFLTKVNFADVMFCQTGEICESIRNSEFLGNFCNKFIPIGLPRLRKVLDNDREWYTRSVFTIFIATPIKLKIISEYVKQKEVTDWLIKLQVNLANNLVTRGYKVQVKFKSNLEDRTFFLEDISPFLDEEISVVDPAVPAVDLVMESFGCFCFCSTVALEIISSGAHFVTPSLRGFGLDDSLFDIGGCFERAVKIKSGSMNEVERMLMITAASPISFLSDDSEFKRVWIDPAENFSEELKFVISNGECMK